MIKGKSIIELTNQKTGEVKKYENENLITNGALNYMQNLMVTNNYRYAENQTLMDDLFGGIWLFDNTLVENKNNIFIPDPTTARMIGHAGPNVFPNDTDTTRGIKNQDESGTIENGYRYVYDFGTSKGNGTIRSISLTHSLTGDWGYGIPFGSCISSSSITPNNLYTKCNMFLTNFDANTILSVKTKKSSQGTLLYEIKTFNVTYNNSKFNCDIRFYEVPIQTLSLNKKKMNNIKKNYLKTQQTFTVNVLNDSTYCDNYQVYEDEINYYIIGYIYNFHIYFTQINKQSYEVYQTTIAGLNNIKWVTSSDNHHPIIKDRYIYAKSANMDIVKINIDDINDQEILSKVNALDYKNIILLQTENNSIITNSYIIDKNNNIWSQISPYAKVYDNSNTSLNATLIMKNGLFFYREYNSNHMYVYPSPLYLASINNLETSVTKTEQDTMKITYEVTQVEPEYEEVIYTGFDGEGA